ncbi:MAG: tetratricopeptide repeat protein [Terracidiphilus sp.]
MMTKRDSSRLKLASGRLWLLVVLGLFCAVMCKAQDDQPGGSPDAAAFGAQVNALLAAQQDALSSGDPDRILKTSSSVAAASLALLDNLDAKDQQSRKALGALPYAEGLLSDLPTELSLLAMELHLGEKSDAAELTKHIVSTNPGNAELDLKLAQIFAQGSEADEAVEEAQRAVDLEPASRDAQIALGMAYWKLNGFEYNEETLKAFTAAHQLDPDGFSTNLLLGSIESKYDRFDDAAVHLRAAANANPAAPEPWYQLGMNAFEQSRPAEAHDLLERYLSLYDASGRQNPSQKRLALLTLDQIAAEQGAAPDSTHRAEEEALKQNLLVAMNARDAGPGVGMPALGAGGAGDQTADVDKAGSKTTDSATLAQLRELAANALGNIGTVLARKNDFAGSVTPFKYAAEEDPSSEPVMRNLGMAACIGGSYEDGAQALKQLVAAHPEDSNARGCLGMAEFETGEYADAAANFDSLGDALSKEPLFYATAAAAFARTGDRARAEKVLAGLNSSNQNPQVQAREATAYLDLGEVDNARKLVQAAGADSQPSAEAHRVLGLLALERGDAKVAVTEFQSETAAEHEGTESQLEAQALLAEAMIESGKTAEGESLRVKLARANPDLAKTFFEQGETLRKNGDVQADYEKLTAALALAPHEKEIRAAFESARRAIHTATP